MNLYVVGAAIIHDGRCLLAQRSETMPLPGKWEFPGGKVEEREDPKDALAREIEEELGITVRIGAFLGRGSSQKGNRTIILDVYAAEWLSGEAVPQEHAALVWAQADQLPEFDWAEADIPIIPAVQRLLATQATS